MASRTLRLLQLHDMAHLSLQMTGRDWDEVLKYNFQGRSLWWAFPPLRLSSRCFPYAIPASVLAVLRHECPYWLERASRGKTLYDVSYSYLWVDALPGIEWSRNFREALGYAASRVRPDAGHIAARECIAREEAWAFDSHWSHLSQSRRILRWIVSRPTRPVTMHALRAAIAQTP